MVRALQRGLAKPFSEAGEEAEGAADADGEKDEEEDEGDGDANGLINLWDDVWSRSVRTYPLPVSMLLVLGACWITVHGRLLQGPEAAAGRV